MSIGQAEKSFRRGKVPAWDGFLFLSADAGRQPRRLFAGYRAIDGNSTRPFDQHDDCQRYRQEMVFKSLTLLLAGPVHEEAVDVMYRRDGDEHIDDDAQRCDTAEQTNQKSKATEEFGANCQERQRRRNSHLLGEEPHGAVEAVPSKPAQHLLRAVREENECQAPGERW